MTSDKISISIGIDYWVRVLDAPICIGPCGVGNNSKVVAWTTLEKVSWSVFCETVGAGLTLSFFELRHFSTMSWVTLFNFVVRNLRVAIIWISLISICFWCSSDLVWRPSKIVKRSSSCLTMFNSHGEI